MTSLTSIANDALILMGEPVISDINEASKPARVIKAAWPSVRDKVLSLYPWNVATRRASLAQLAAAPEIGWLYAYQLPDQTLRVLGTWDNEYERPGFRDFIVENGQVLTDAIEIWVRYIIRVDNVALYPPWLVDAMSARLAWQTVFAITSSQTVRAEMKEAYDKAMSEAKRIDADEQPIAERPVGDWVTARF